MIEEKAPLYFSEFEQRINKKLRQIQDEIGEVKEQQNLHFETLGEIKIQLTGIEKKLNTKADNSLVQDIEQRTGKLEKMIFV